MVTPKEGSGHGIDGLWVLGGGLVERGGSFCGFGSSESRFLYSSTQN
jgi:hypothetical protein